MVSVNLVGRMSNQQFQICCCIAYALRHGLEYHIPAHTQNDLVWKPMFTHLENPNWNPHLQSIVVREKGHEYQKIPPCSGENFAGLNNDNFNLIIDGYRQSIRYFEDYLPEVRKAFGFDYTVKRPDTVCLHNRLGDYKLYPSKHTILEPYYIISALTIMKENGYSKCLVFSDGIEETKQTINSIPNINDHFDFEYSEGKTELEDFQLMLECGSFVISASTYSLMAAILSANKDKICISPSSDNWFQIDNKHLNCSDVIPNSFIQIKY